MSFYHHLHDIIAPSVIEDAIREAFHFKQRFYTDQNLERHAAYLSDTTPHRTSHAYAVSTWTPQRDFPVPLPTLNLENIPEVPTIANLYEICRGMMGLDDVNRVLFNVQEYYGGSEAVPKHNDGELLDFTAFGSELKINRAIRPDYVCVITLVNDTDGGGTRLHLPDGSTEVVVAKAGDVLMFDNVHCEHSVDPLSGTVKRPDGLLRMTIGFRSLGSRCHYMDGDILTPMSKDEAEGLTQAWYKQEWPHKWAELKGSAAKAAF